MAGTIELTNMQNGKVVSESINPNIDFVDVATCVADAADGSFPATTIPVGRGKVTRVVSDPGSPAPTAAWDFVLNDVNGVDILGGGGANRDAANTEQILPDPPVQVDGDLSLVITNNSVNSAEIVIKVYVER